MGTFDFNQSVLERSFEVPVVVDFWASWCGPCKILGPVIEALAEEANGEWELVKVSTEEHPEVSQKFDIMSIPAVKLFWQGEEIAEFVGALPRHMIQKWLADHLPNEDKDELAYIQDQLMRGEVETALPELEMFVSQHPDLMDGRILLASATVIEDPDRAVEMVADQTIGKPYYNQAEDIRTLAELMDTRNGVDVVVGIKIGAAREALENHDLEAGLKFLIEAVIADKTYLEELPRRASIALFNRLGKDHELTRKYRKHFDMALY